jgi:adenylate cyclase class 2
VRQRRLQADSLLDTQDGRLRGARSTLRVRVDNDRCILTYKGAPQPSAMKLREEIETTAGDPAVLLAILERIGFAVTFRYEKYREEYARAGATIAIDDTPIGTYVEIEGSEEAIDETARALGRGPADYILDSYRALFVAHCAGRGVPPADMIFER